MTSDKEIEVGAVRRFGSHVVGREEIVAFATLYDPQPFHLSEEAAASSPFGRLVASGWHTCAMMMGMLVREGPRIVDVERGGIGLGAQDLKWLHPVHPGDTLSCETRILSKSRSGKRPEMDKVSLQVTVLNQDGAAVMVCTMNGLTPR